MFMDRHASALLTRIIWGNMPDVNLQMMHRSPASPEKICRTRRPKDIEVRTHTHSKPRRAGVPNALSSIFIRGIK